ncbi:MAG: HAMP domain-containing histidine kinase [Nitrospirae bacterium]|nr:HAMP domain-containing histidine kinase [Nitrospirota bacterium]
MPPLTLHATRPLAMPSPAGSTPLTELVLTVAARCQAQGALLLSREGSRWRVAVSTGCSAFRLPEGTVLSVADNPTLATNLSGHHPHLTVTPDPFLAALGPLAEWDWLPCPLLTAAGQNGTLYLFTEWDQPFTGTQVELATLGADLIASHLATAPEAGGATVPDRDTATLAVSIVNHDLRSPANAILGFAELLVEHGDDPRAVARYAHIIRHSGTNMMHMLDQAVLLLRTGLGGTVWHPAHAPLALALDGLPATGAPDGMVRWDTGRVRMAVAALRRHGEDDAEPVAVAAGEETITITVGTPQADFGPADPASRHLATQVARVVARVHGGTLDTDAHATAFRLDLPRWPEWPAGADR